MINSLVVLLLLMTTTVGATQLPAWKVHPLVKGEFSQQKKTKHLRRPIKSSGTILLSSKMGNAQGIIWQTLKPVKTAMVLKPSQIITIDSQGKRKKVSGGSDLNLVFLNALRGNWTLLEQHFALNTSVVGERHCVDMSPKTGLTQKTLKHIQVCGSKTAIDSMTINEHNGGTTEISMTLKPYRSLSDEERALFNDE